MNVRDNESLMLDEALNEIASIDKTQDDARKRRKIVCDAIVETLKGHNVAFKYGDKIRAGNLVMELDSLYGLRVSKVECVPTFEVLIPLSS